MSWKLSILLCCLAACSGRSTRTISGQLDLTQFPVSRTYVVAFSTSGHAYRAAVSPSTGAFRLALPIGASYTLRFANATARPHFYDAFAVLAARKPATRNAHWFTLTDGGSIHLGRIARAGTLGPVASVQSEDNSDDGGDNEPCSGSGEDQTGNCEDGNQDDGAQACDLSGASLGDAQSENDVNDQTGNRELSDDQAQEGDNEADAPCSGAARPPSLARQQRVE